MNLYQLARQIRHRLAELTWPTHLGTDGSDVPKVFGARSVAIFSGDVTDEQRLAGFPWALIIMDSGRQDGEDLGTILSRLQIAVVAEVKGDPLGEFAMIGSAAPAGSRMNRGVMEVVEQVQRAIEAMSTADGLTLSVTGIVQGVARQIGQVHRIAVQLSLEAATTIQPYWAAPQRVAINMAGTSISWAGTHCANRYDFIDFRVMEKVGTSPSTSVTDGTAVYTGTAAAAAVSTVSGRTYTVFARYSDRGTEVTAASSPEVGTWRTR